MRNLKIILIFSAILIGLIAIFCTLSSPYALVIHPKGFIARQELHLMSKNIILMLILIGPTFLLLLGVVWKYRADNDKIKYEPEKSYGFFTQLFVWLIPSIVVLMMGMITWKATFALDPYKPLESETKSLTIQVIALDWKWLFIYPEQNIATLNFVQFPERTPVRFELAADGSPMNSFWIPELSGQLYCMTGMVTPLHIIADGPGTYSGKAAEINGIGYAKMTFVAKSSSQADFDDWVSQVQKSTLKLDELTYNNLIPPSIPISPAYYSNVKKGLFEKAVMKYMHPECIHSTSRIGCGLTHSSRG